MRTDVRREGRIRDLTNMALAGAKIEDIRHRAYKMAAKKTAEEYLDQMYRNIQKAKK